MAGAGVRGAPQLAQRGGQSRGATGGGWRRRTRATAADAKRWAIKGCDRGRLAQVYAGHRGGREKVAIKVMQVPGDHRERVLKEFSQESLLLSICYTDFVLGFRGVPCCGALLAVMQCSQPAHYLAGEARGDYCSLTCSTSTGFADRGVELFCRKGLPFASPGPCVLVVQTQAPVLLLQSLVLAFSLPAREAVKIQLQKKWRYGGVCAASEGCLAQARPPACLPPMLSTMRNRH